MTFSNWKTKLGVGIAAAALTAVVGTATVASVYAQSPGQLPTTKEQCKHGGWMHFKNADGSKMFKNQGQCVSTVEHNNGHGGGHGYGGGNGHGYGGSNGNTINANVNVSLNNSDNNIINVIVRLIFGA